MKLFNVTVPFTEPSREEQIEALQNQVKQQSKFLEQGHDHIIRLQREAREKDGKLQELKGIKEGSLHWYTRNIELERSLRNSGASLSLAQADLQNERHALATTVRLWKDGYPREELPSHHRTLELVRTAQKIAQAAFDSAGLHDELYAVRLENAADLQMAGMTPGESKFFRAVLGGDYTPPEARSVNEKTEREILDQIHEEEQGEDDPNQETDAIEPYEDSNPPEFQKGAGSENHSLSPEVARQVSALRAAAVTPVPLDNQPGHDLE